MNMFTRLFFVFCGIVGLSIFFSSFTSSDKLSEGQSLMLLSLVPASLMLCSAAFYIKKCANEFVSVVLFLFGAFFMLLFLGSYKQSGEFAYGFFAFLGLAACCLSVVFLMLDVICRAEPARSWIANQCIQSTKPALSKAGFLFL